jgi:hypothetical protein
MTPEEPQKETGELLTQHFGLGPIHWVCFSDLVEYVYHAVAENKALPIKRLDKGLFKGAGSTSFFGREPVQQSKQQGTSDTNRQ